MRDGCYFIHVDTTSPNRAKSDLHIHIWVLCVRCVPIPTTDTVLMFFVFSVSWLLTWDVDVQPLVQPPSFWEKQNLKFGVTLDVDASWTFTGWVCVRVLLLAATSCRLGWRLHIGKPTAATYPAHGFSGLEVMPTHFLEELAFILFTMRDTAATASCRVPWSDQRPSQYGFAVSYKRSGQRL